MGNQAAVDDVWGRQERRVRAKAAEDARVATAKAGGANGGVRPDGDRGPATALAQAGVVVGEETDHNGKRRARRVHPLEVMYKRGTISPRQFCAGLALSAIYELTETKPEPQLFRCDRSPNPGAAQDFKIIALDRVAYCMRALDRNEHAAVYRVVCKWMCGREAANAAGGRQVTAFMDTLRRGLDKVADRLLSGGA